jgi:DNA modification methylase
MILHLRGREAPDLDAPKLTELLAHQEFNAPDGRLGDRYYKWQKPDGLAELHIRHATREGDFIIDPFMGSGTFLVVAARLGRRAVGCDIDGEVIKIARGRGCVIKAL